MAGIGFVLRKLMRKEDLTSLLEAYFHATLASSGAWLFTVLALGSFFFVFQSWPNMDDVENFRAIILYNFSLSLVLTSPIIMLATRHLADCIYERKIEEATGMLLGSLIVAIVMSCPFAYGLYFMYASLSSWSAWMAVINFLLTSSIWVITIFISATRNYKTVTFSFLAGLMIAVLASVYFGVLYAVAGMLLGFNIGLGFIVSSLLASILAQYPLRYTHLFTFLAYTRKYWEFAVGGLCYNLAIWIDKWIMWFSPAGETLSSGLRVCPYYDSAMFAAYLTIVPGMAMFLLTQETSFFEVYINFYRDIQEHVNLKKIQSNHRELVHSIFYSGRNTLFLQLSVCVITLLLTPTIFNFFGVNFIKLGMFRYGVLGATFQVLIIYFAILLSYFDYRSGVLAIQLLFFIANTLLTLLTLELGFPFYGYGYFMSTLITFAAAGIIAGRYIQNLPYHAFITSNASVVDV